MQIRIGTFNCENLYVYHRLRKLDIRFELGKTTGKSKTKKEFEKYAYEDKLAKIRYDSKGVPITSLEQGWSITDEQRKNTARLIAENQPDIIALQEVENLDTLNRFYSNFMQKKVKDLRGIYGDKQKKVQWKMDYRIAIDGNDNHRIDVGLMSRFPINGIRTHIWDRHDTGKMKIPMFPRDCLEVDVKIPGSGKTVTFLVNHFTSRREGPQTSDKRKRQAKAVIKIVKERFGKKLEDGNFVIMGDLNDSPNDESLKSTLYSPTLNLINPLESKPENERWTHFWYDDETGVPNKHEPVAQLDHLILSPTFKKSSIQNVKIDRRGLLRTIEKVDDVGDLPEPFNGITEKPGREASDHCPIFVDVDIKNLK